MAVFTPAEDMVRADKQLARDCYYMSIAAQVETNSKCRSRHIGAVLVKDNSIISTGYNGPPRGMRPCDERWIEDGLYTLKTFEGVADSGQTPFIAHACDTSEEEDAQYLGMCPRRVLGFPSGKGLEICVAGHAERNALLQAAKSGVSTKGATLYCHCGQVCKDCAIEIINAGVAELVYLDGQPDYDELANTILDECDIVVRRIVE